MKIIIMTCILIMISALAVPANAGHRRGGIEWGVGLSPNGIVFGIGSRGSGAGNIGSMGVAYPGLYEEGYQIYPSRTPALMSLPFCTGSNTFFFPDGAILGGGRYFLPPGTYVPPGLCYY